MRDADPATTLPCATPPCATPARALVVAIRAPLARASIPSLCDRLDRLLDATDAELVVCDLSDVRQADAGVVEAIVRFRLVAARRGLDLRLRRACDELLGLVRLIGLDEVLST